MALTNIAELCAQQSYYQHTHTQPSTTAAGAASATGAAIAAQAAAAAAKASCNKFSIPDSYPFPSDSGNSLSGTGSTSFSYPSMSASSQGNVPFPPLSFSQTLTPEAMAAFEASLSSTVQQTKYKTSGSKGTASGLSDVPTSFGGLTSLTSSLSQSLQSSGLTSSGLPFGLGHPSVGGSSNASRNMFLPPPTPVTDLKAGDGSTCFPQLSASSQHLLLRHADAIPTLISLLSSPNREVYEQAMWILGSIAAGDSTGAGSVGSGSSGSSGDGSREKSVGARDVILAAGIMNQLLRCLDTHPTNLSLQRIGSWTLSNLLEGIFQQPSHGKSGSKSSSYSSSDEIVMSTLLPVLRRLLRISDAEVLSYTCWTLSHLCDGPSSHIAAVVTTEDSKGPRGGLVPRLVELLLHPSWRVTKPALRTIGNIVCAECSDDTNHSSSSSLPTDYTEIILYCGAVPRLMELVTHSNREIQKEACWTLSNIAAGTVDQIQAVIDSGAIPPLVKLVSDKKTDQEVRSEACWVVLNATSCGSDSQIEILVEEGCVSVLGVLLGEPSMVLMALEGLERVLQVEEARETTRREKRKKENKGDHESDEANSPVLVSASLIEKALEKHNSNAVTKRATRIWKQHFVSCALCNESFSKHRTAEATFCDECKCYVCSKCDCEVYHLSYQEELWAATEEKTEAKKNAKKSKNKKKKQKQKKTKQSTDSQSLPNKGEASAVTVNATPTGKFLPLNESSAESGSGKSRGEASSTSDDVADKKDSKEAYSSSLENSPDSEPEVDEEQQPPIDFVLYLQETGSIIALAKLMDALDYGDGGEYNGQELELDDKELELFRNLQTASQRQATN